MRQGASIASNHKPLHNNTLDRPVWAVSDEWVYLAMFVLKLHHSNNQILKTEVFHEN